ncbi:MAG: SIMPL domain-containing protein [Pseudomonadota bacterium]
MIRTIRPLALAAALAAPGTLSAQTGSGEAATACAGRVTAPGVGAVEAVPDRLRARILVEREAEAPGAAMDAASAAMSEVLAALKEAGVAGADIATDSVTLSPVRDRPEGRGETPEIVGWRAGGGLRVTFEAPRLFGEAAQAAIAAGATGIGSLVQEVSDREALLAQAREAAVRDALEQAGRMARAAELSLGEVLEIAPAGEGGGPGPAPFAAMAEARAMPVEPGQVTLTAEVRAVVELCR